jgi:aspartate racemase
MEMKQKPLLGVIGGIGPYAGLDFVRNIFNNTIALRDQEHIGTLLVSCPAIIPDRTKYLLDEETVNPAAGLFEATKILYAGGARYAAVACNTAHSNRIFKPFCEMVHNTLPEMFIVNMLETCAKFVKENIPHIKKIGYLATPGTYKSRVYREYFTEADGFDLMEPESQGKNHINDAIYSLEFGIKAHSNPVRVKACNILLYEGFRLLDHGAEALILGCTELPLAVDPSDFSVPILDPGVLVARELIRCIDEKKLAPFKAFV